ncbi:MAG: glycoside hydrolase family 2 TIM barrel-domain containing protein [Rikenellaceae bacterium]
MIRKYLLLCVAISFAFVVYGQEEQGTRNSFLTHSAFYSYPTESAALGDVRKTNPKYIEVTTWSYLTLKDKSKFTKSLLYGSIDTLVWKSVPRVNKASIASDDKIVVYRAEITLKKYAVFREVYMSVGAAASSSTIYVNGREVGGSYDSKATIEYDITEYLNEGLNNVAVVCSADASSIEASSRLGIASEIDIYSKNKVHILNISYVPTFPSSGDKALLEVQMTLKSHLLNKKAFRIEYKLLSQDGEVISRSFIDSDIDMRSSRNFPFLSTIKDPKLWSPSSPYLYTMLFTLTQEGRVTEVVRQDVGLRDYASNKDHIVAVTLTPNISYNKEEAQAEADLIRSVGVNTIISKSPMNDTYLTACDKAGLYVVDMVNIDNSKSGNSLLVGGSFANDPRWLENHKERVEHQLLQHANHTSLAAWQLVGGGANGYNIYESYLHAKDLEKRVPILNSSAAGEWNSDSAASLFGGVVGAWVKGDMLNMEGALSEKSYKMMDTQSSVYVRAEDLTKGSFRITNNNAEPLGVGEVTYKMSVNDILIREGVVEDLVKANSFIIYTISHYKDIPLPIQIKHSQQLRFGKTFKIEIFYKGALVYSVKVQ